jgi:hypothetical protein
MVGSVLLIFSVFFCFVFVGLCCNRHILNWFQYWESNIVYYIYYEIIYFMKRETSNDYSFNSNVVDTCVNMFYYTFMYLWTEYLNKR